MTNLRVLNEGREVDNRSVQHSKQQDRNAGEDDIVGSSADAVHQSLPAESIVELVEEQHKGEADVLIEGVLDEAGEAVAGEAAMHQQQAHQEAELPDGVVRVVHSLQESQCKRGGKKVFAACRRVDVIGVVKSCSQPAGESM